VCIIQCLITRRNKSLKTKEIKKNERKKKCKEIDCSVCAIHRSHNTPLPCAVGCSIHAFTSVHTRFPVCTVVCAYHYTDRSLMSCDFVCLIRHALFPCRRVCSTLYFVWFCRCDRFCLYFFQFLCDPSVWCWLLSLTRWCTVSFGKLRRCWRAAALHAGSSPLFFL